MVEEPAGEQQLQSSTDQRSCRPDVQVVSAASSNSDCESMSVAPQPPHDTQDSDQGVRRSLLAPAEIRSRPHTTKASVWFLHTTSLVIPYRMADRPRLLLVKSNIDKFRATPSGLKWAILQRVLLATFQYALVMPHGSLGPPLFHIDPFGTEFS